MLYQLPTLPEPQYYSLLQRKSLIQVVRLLARVLSAVLPQPLLLKLRLPENFRQISRQDVSKNKNSLSQFLPKEASSVMTKLAFLTLVKSSNAIFQPKKAQMAGGVAIHKTRYSIETMTTIFQSKILPVVSSKDRPFLKRLFEHAHVMHQNDKRLHVAIGLSMIRSKQGVCCFTVEGHRRIWKSFCDHCSLCLKLSTSDSLGKYRHQLSDPRLASLLPVESPVYHTVSIDILGPFILKQYRGARGCLRTYKSYGLYC